MIIAQKAQHLVILAYCGIVWYTIEINQQSVIALVDLKLGGII